MLTKDSFSLDSFFMLPNTRKHGTLSLHKVFHRNKQSVTIKSINCTFKIIYIFLKTLKFGHFIVERVLNQLSSFGTHRS